MKWLNQNEVAELLHVPNRTVSDWRYRDVGPSYYKFGKHIRYSIDDVNRYIEERRVKKEGDI